MKKLISIVFIAAIVITSAISCTNDAETNKKADTVSLDVNTNTNNGDTSSYDRMPNRITDSMP